MSEIRTLLKAVILGLLDRQALSEDQAETLRCWASFAPGDDLLEAFETPTVHLQENPWPSFGLEDEEGQCRGSVTSEV